VAELGAALLGQRLGFTADHLEDHAAYLGSWLRAPNETDHRLMDSRFMRHELVSDEMWAAVEPLLPEEPPKPKGGRPRVPDRDALRGIVFVLRSGLPWEMLPREVFGCSGMTCWRRLRDWQAAGVWDRLHRVLLERLHRAGELEWGRAALDSQSIAAKRGAPRRGRTRPTGASRAPSATRSPTRAARRSA
jgi:transposase